MTTKTIPTEFNIGQLARAILRQAATLANPELEGRPAHAARMAGLTEAWTLLTMEADDIILMVGDGNRAAEPYLVHVLETVRAIVEGFPEYRASI